MCSHSLKMMENYQGDLADIVRATTAAAEGGVVGTAAEQAAAAAVPDWQFSRNSITYPSEYFGDPFSYMRDPLTPNIDTTTPVSDLFFNSNTITAGGDAGNNSRVNCGGGGGGGGGVNLAHNKVVDDEVKRPSNIFSRMLQISPGAKLPAAAAAVKNPPILVSNSGINLISPPSGSGLQISSPRNAGIKRRKSQAKKVVCIPAPAPANSRSTGEVVPSDLWAWRKYGQKPIKGSPFPRGYYRCSSSKGCSARKQVERSRTDPNMLVITYTSEHNHPWPTQRNALAGSTRSQAAKNKDSSQTEQQRQQQQSMTTKEASSPVEDGCRAVKEEGDDQDLDRHFEAEFGDGLLQTYKPTLADPSNHEQDSFFADLGEIGDDPLNLFGQGFSRDGHNDLDPFSFYDWATNGSAATKGGPGEESGRKS